MVRNIVRMRVETGVDFSPQSVDLSTATNVMDRWIQAATRQLINTVREEMDFYHLYNVVPFLVKFIDHLTNIYVRFNRKRLKGRGGTEDCEMALATLFDTLLKVRHTSVSHFQHCSVIRSM
jgi:isoleucyl-tRNA synthetase